METRSQKNKHKQRSTNAKYIHPGNQNISKDDDSEENSLNQQNRQLPPDFEMDEKGNICAIDSDEETGTKKLTPVVDILKALYEVALSDGHASPRILREVEETLKRYPKK